MTNPEIRGLAVLLADESVTWHWLPEDFKVSNTPHAGLDRTAEHPERDSADRKDCSE